jgi:hypothetical protein
LSAAATPTAHASFCATARLLSVAELLENLGEGELLSALLADTAALRTLAGRLSDTLSDWEAGR